MSSIIYLIGFRGSGKTTIGNILSNKLNYVFNDIDYLIQKKYKQSIYDIVKKHGWEKFREIESNLLRQVTTSFKVISTGGGIILNKKNCSFMQSNGKIFYLHVKDQILENRLTNDLKKEQRPPLIYKNNSINQEISILLPKRMKIYKKIAHFVIDNNLNSPDKAVELILNYIN